MQKTSEIKHHIGAVEETRKITNAMQLVSTSRLRKVMQHIDYNNHMFERIRQTMRDLLYYTQNEVSHPYLTVKNGNRRTYIVIAGDKGLAGSYNADVLNLAMQYLKDESREISLVSVGLVAADFFVSHGMLPDVQLKGTIQDPSVRNAWELTKEVMKYFDQNLTDEIYIIYTSFFGETKNKPVVRRLLPILVSDYDDLGTSAHPGGIIYEPSAEVLFEHLVPQYILGLLFGALVQSYASEHFARMNAMQSATRNADEMLETLKMEYNLARQAAITQEIIEMTGANAI